jgi:acetyl esterase/lipase
LALEPIHQQPGEYCPAIDREAAMGDRPTGRKAVRRLAVGVGLSTGCHRAAGPAPDPAPDDGDGRLRYGPARSQFGEMTVPDGPGPHPVAVAVHGGFWAAAYGLDHLRPFCAALAETGWAV